MTAMNSNQPYLLRAFYDWIVDNALTPYVVVDANKEGVDVPREFVQNGQIVLNISPSACVNLHLDLEILTFQARFGGTPRFLSMPCEAIVAIYARENGAGTVFVNEQETPESLPTPDDDNATPPQPVGKPVGKPDGDDTGAPRPKPSGRPSLKIIK